MRAIMKLKKKKVGYQPRRLFSTSTCVPLYLLPEGCRFHRQQKNSTLNEVIISHQLNSMMIQYCTDRSMS